MQRYEPKYSGPGKSGVCKCGHSVFDHHLGIVLNQEYFEATGESYVPQECEAYGFNETGGLKCIDGKWAEHCERYRDTMDKPDSIP